MDDKQLGLEELQRQLGVTIGSLQTVVDAQGRPVVMLVPEGEELDIVDACKYRISSNRRACSI
jgi:hypothetical protein